MSFGEGNLRERVKELERRNEILQADVDFYRGRWIDLYRGRWMARGAAIAKQKERIGELESLVRDMYESMNTVSESWAFDMYHERMAALGIEGSDGD